MSATSTCHLMVGVELSNICKFVDESEVYEVHDEKTGKPTGEKKTEKKARVVFDGNIADIELVWEKDYYGGEDWSGLYAEDLEGLFEGLDVEYHPGHSLLHGTVVGRTILDGTFESSLTTTDVDELLDATAVVKQAFADLGFDVKPEVHMIHYYS